MNVVKAFVNAFNTYRDGTTVPTVPMVELYRYRGTSNSTSKYRGTSERSYAMHLQSLGTIHWCTR